MQYEDARPQIKSGDLLAFGHNSWATWKDIKSQIVRIACRSDYSHVATAYVVSGRVFAIEAVIPRVRVYPLSLEGDFYWIKMNAPWKKTTEKKALSFVGNPYSQWAAVKAFFVNIGADNTQECAALAITIANADGIILGTKQTPDAVVLAAQQRGGVMQYVENGGRK